MPPIQKHPKGTAIAIILLVLVSAFGTYLFLSYPEIKDGYKTSFSYVANATSNVAKRVLSVFSFSQKNKSGYDTNSLTGDNIDSANIDEFGTSSNISIIDEQSTSTNNALYPDGFASTTASSTDGIKKPKQSPESAWASLYLNALQMKQEDLKLDIRYVKEWQQIGGFTRDLKLNSKGSDVRLMQYLLSIFDPTFKPTFISSTFGAKTRSSLIALQKKLNIKPTGTLTDETRFFFDSVYFKELCPDANPDQDRSFENVDRRNSVPLDYIPSDLIRLPRTVRTVGVMCLSREPAEKLDELFAEAKKSGHELAVFSAYRSANTQKLLTAHYLKTLGKGGLAGVAEAGHSEHQLGTTVDLTGKSIKYTGPNSKFGIAKEGAWLAQNSYKYGYIISYPAGKQSETGYIYEPWHFRYVGIDMAKEIFDGKKTIQEYLRLVKSKKIESSAIPEL